MLLVMATVTPLAIVRIIVRRRRFQRNRCDYHGDDGQGSAESNSTRDTVEFGHDESPERIIHDLSPCCEGYEINGEQTPIAGANSINCSYS
jgi:hypothetical protein